MIRDEHLSRNYQQQLLPLISGLAERLDISFAPAPLPSRQTQVLAPYDRAIAARLPGNVVKALNRYYSERDEIAGVLGSLRERAKAQAVAAHAPLWLRKASATDQDHRHPGPQPGPPGVLE
ncbi:hypothetical protein [Pseudomonas wadenswilerensis]|uniref:hypothetical protein n=1 Tax=Pseudomonas wadenswilerensis TaxID=1785161 RepID=UPI00215F7A23|nr:hypothetical protein [Pseudomonas wadenswilerensis]UVM22849.1 hypothetical protein LOY45_04565 [Pseudomonas wadenswilerensis]